MTCLSTPSLVGSFERIDVYVKGAAQSAHQEKSLSNSLWEPIQDQITVSPCRWHTARYCSLIRTDHTSS